MTHTTIHERLTTITGDRTVKSLSNMTGTPCETGRRYMAGTTPSAEFMSALCEKLRINGDWLLLGRGPMRTEQMRAAALEHADPSELLPAMAQTIEMLLTRVERLERFVQTQEARIRSGTENEERDGERTDDAAAERGRRIADAIPERPPQADD